MLGYCFDLVRISFNSLCYHEAWKLTPSRLEYELFRAKTLTHSHTTPERLCRCMHALEREKNWHKFDNWTIIKAFLYRVSLKKIHLLIVNAWGLIERLSPNIVETKHYVPASVNYIYIWTPPPPRFWIEIEYYCKQKTGNCKCRNMLKIGCWL